MRDKRAAFLFAQGETSEAENSLQAAEDLVREQVEAGGDCLSLRQNLLRNREAAFSTAAELNPSNRVLNDELVRTQTSLADLESGGACE